MKNEKTHAQKEAFFTHLLDHVMPFWEKNALDFEYGGIYTGLDRAGNIIETDKSVWFQGRAAWVFATLYNQIEKRESWRTAAALCVDFIETHCFDTDGKMFFRVTYDGKPVIRRERYIFSETFSIIALAAYAHTTGDHRYIEKARTILHSMYTRVDNNLLIPKFNPTTRPMEGKGYHMIMINTLQELRKYDTSNEREYTHLINGHIEKMKLFVKDDMGVVLEVIDKHGAFMPTHIEGRVVNPGHDMEAGWFLLHEGIYQHNEEIISLGLKIIDYAWHWGWDKEYGGITYFRDALHYPVSEYWHSMKFWWPQCEAIIALLMAYKETHDERYWERYNLILDWTHTHFIDTEYGEWFGYLRRDGSISSEIKGNMYKGPFHIPRMYIMCISMLEELIEN